MEVSEPWKSTIDCPWLPPWCLFETYIEVHYIQVEVFEHWRSHIDCSWLLPWCFIWDIHWGSLYLGGSFWTLKVPHWLLLTTALMFIWDMHWGSLYLGGSFWTLKVPHWLLLTTALMFIWDIHCAALFKEANLRGRSEWANETSNFISLTLLML